MAKNKVIDVYIAKAAPFAKPILTHIRNLVHQACPEVEEQTKWGFPHFDYKGMCISMAGFKAHCSLGFWKASLMKDPQKLFTRLSGAEGTGMGHLGKITSLKDLPSDKILLAYFKEAIRLNEEGITLPPRAKPPVKDKKELILPPALVAGLKKNKKAATQFKAFSYSHQKEYAEWIGEAKTEETIQKRLATTLEWLEEGKSRNWKYK
ncbi:MAG TPA: DUF1801 domain-containing protein [Bacteroidia bacterium]|jgi:uncharacterized protein YdeI (YjbR/CyaY-like superfamily)|nr:DUF1801 domain-containing protein [Bacteroidia bacterium]